MKEEFIIEKPLIELEAKIKELKELSKNIKADFSEEIAKLEEKARKLTEEFYNNLSPWQIVKIARHPNRPQTLDYINHIFTSFLELHGDYVFADDPAIIGGLARFEGEPVMIVGHQKGKNTKENLKRNFGMPYPDGFRKAGRLMKLAEKFSLPIITFIDTPGAYPGIEAEERGQFSAIARNLFLMSSLATPIIVCVTGEGGSGGALGIALGDVVLMLEYAIYSVISPEGCASILWRDAKKAPEAAKSLKLTAKDLKEFGVIDEMVSEPIGGAHKDFITTAENLRVSIKKYLSILKNKPLKQLLLERYQKYRQIGKFIIN